MKKKFHGLILDLDGTLLNTLPDITAAVNSSLAEYQLKPRSESEIASFIFGGEENLISMSMPNNIDVNMKLKVLESFRVNYQSRLTTETREYKGISRFLLRCVRNGIKLSVLSNKPEKYTIPIINHFFPNIPFLEIHGNTGESTKKPKPIKALQIAARMGVRPQAILFVGDTITDLNTARNANMNECLVSWGFRSPQVLKGYYPRKIVRCPDELFQYLQKK